MPAIPNHHAKIRTTVALAFAVAAVVFSAQELRRRPATAAGLPRLAGDIRLDVNTARTGELSALPGIGQKTAEAIVADRAARGPFESPADLCRIKGIGPAKFKRVEKWVEAR